jgi:Mg-chelatase subunit ChlD
MLRRLNIKNTFVNFFALLLTFSVVIIPVSGRKQLYKRKFKVSLKNESFNKRLNSKASLSVFKEVEIKLRVFIPSEAVNFWADIGNLRYMYGGDGRSSYSYNSGTSRFDLAATVTTDPRQNPLLSKEQTKVVTTTRYLKTDGQHKAGKPGWWWTLNPKAAAQKCKDEDPGSTRECKSQTIPDFIKVSSSNDRVLISFKFSGVGNPFPILGNLGGEGWYPAPDGDFVIGIQQCGDEILYRYSGWHNAFPAYELYINRQRVYEFMPDTPIAMTGIYNERLSINWKKLGKPSEDAKLNPEATCEPATLFLFDTSGSMQENSKIEQARSSALNALNTIKNKVNNGGIAPPLSVVAFSGACSPTSARQLLAFTNNLNQVENIIKSGIPSPSGETPLPQARQAASDLLSKYLENNPVPDGQVILLSDGQSTCDSLRPNGTYYTSQSKSLMKTTGNSQSNTNSSQIRYLTIGFDVPPGSAAERDLQYLASISNGKYFNAPDKRQLTRVFEKFVQTFIPKMAMPKSESDLKWFSDFSEGIQAIESKNYPIARQKFQKVLSVSPDNSAALFNLAQSLEANDRYKGAVNYYQRYLQSTPQAADKALIEQKITTLKQDYKDQFEYYLKIIESDLTYLKKYYDELFKKQNSVLAAEFAGFVTEKGEFYTNLQDVLEIQDKNIKEHSKDLSDGLYNLSDRVDSKVFDRDAVSLLTIPISELEEILELLKKDKAKFMNI